MSLIYSACTTPQKNSTAKVSSYVPDSKTLYDTIVRLDSIFFDAYNHCNLSVMSEMLSDNIEFYHDKGGLSKSKADLMKAIENNICGKVTRELMSGTIEVYQISGFGAVQMGQHRFYNKIENPTIPSRPGKFVHTWQFNNGRWKLYRIISLH